jgi:hypothetical protein
MADIEAETKLKANAFNQIAAILGGSLEWESDHLDYIAGVVTDVVRQLGLPGIGDQNRAALTFWSNVADKYNIEHDNVDEIEWDENGDQA